MGQLLARAEQHHAESDWERLNDDIKSIIRQKLSFREMVDSLRVSVAAQDPRALVLFWQNLVEYTYGSPMRAETLGPYRMVLNMKRLIAEYDVRHGANVIRSMRFWRSAFFALSRVIRALLVLIDTSRTLSLTQDDTIVARMFPRDFIQTASPTIHVAIMPELPWIDPTIIFERPPGAGQVPISDLSRMAVSTTLSHNNWVATRMARRNPAVAFHSAVIVDVQPQDPVQYPAVALTERVPAPEWAWQVNTPPNLRASSGTSNHVARMPGKFVTYLHRLSANMGLVLSAASNKTDIMATVAVPGSNAVQFERRRGHPIVRLTAYNAIEILPADQNLISRMFLRYVGTVEGLDLDECADWLYATFTVQQSDMIRNLHGTEDALLTAATINNLRQGLTSLLLVLHMERPSHTHVNKGYPATDAVIKELRTLMANPLAEERASTKDFIMLIDLCLSDYGAMLNEFGSKAEQAFDALVNYVLTAPWAEADKPVLFMAK